MVRILEQSARASKRQDCRIPPDDEHPLKEAADFCAARGFEFFPYFGHIGGIDALQDR